MLREYASSSDNVSGIVFLSEYWLYECFRNHAECAFDPSFGSSSDMPRRFVDLRSFVPNSSKSIVKVVNTGGKCRPYAALSYRWPQKGMRTPITLSGESQSLLNAGFHPECLSMDI